MQLPSSKQKEKNTILFRLLYKCFNETDMSYNWYGWVGGLKGQ